MELVVKKYEELTVDELYEILRLRAEVFVVEQNCVYQDLDGKDKKAYHVFLKRDGEVVACLRVLPKGVSYPDAESIGRIVSKIHKSGLGKIVVAEGIKVAREKFGAKRLLISAQVQAQGFYEKQGFSVVTGETYLEDDIPHTLMQYAYDD